MLISTLGLSAAAAGAASSSQVGLVASINGRDLNGIDSNRPLRLQAEQGAVIKVAVTNKTSNQLTVRSVRLHGKVMGLTFYTYDTRVDLQLGPGASGEREFAVDLADLKGQATGLVPGQLSLLDAKHHTVLSKAFTVDVRGSMYSVYGVFGILVAAITALLLIAALVRLAAHRLPPNRWSRAIRFAVPGVGIGLVLTFSLSAFRVFSPTSGTWLPLVLLGGAAGFVVGYLTPSPIYDDEDWESTGAPMPGERVSAQ